MHNVLRGLHYQIEHPQCKLIRVLTGCICDVAVDLRRASPASGQSASIELKADDNLLLWIPPGYAHGFLVLDGPSEAAYSVTDYRFAEYDTPCRGATRIWRFPGRWASSRPRCQTKTGWSRPSPGASAIPEKRPAARRLPLPFITRYITQPKLNT